MKNKRLLLMFLAAGIVLLIPLIAMQFSSEVNWTAGDFIVMALLLGGTVSLCEIVLRKAKSLTSRMILCSGVVLAFLLIWAELAVGIF
jgi:hypothetical protein